MSEFIPPQDAIVKEETKEIDFIPPADAETDETVEVEKKSDPKTQSPATDPKDGESSSEDSLSELSPDKLGTEPSDKKIKPIKTNLGKLEVIEEIDIEPDDKNTEEVTKLFNEGKGYDTAFLGLKGKDYSNAYINSLTKTSKPFLVEETEEVLKVDPSTGLPSEGLKQKQKGNYYVPTYTVLDNEGNQKQIQGNAVYILEDDYSNYFEKTFQKEKKDDEKDEILPEAEVVVKSDKAVLADPNIAKQKLFRVRTQREQLDEKLLKAETEEDKKRIQDKINNFKDLETKYLKELIDAEARQNKLLVEYNTGPGTEKPSPAAWTKPRYFDTNEDGTVSLKADKNYKRYISSLESEETAKKINDTYINHGLVAQPGVGGDDNVSVFKNGVFKKGTSGLVDLAATLRANDIKFNEDLKFDEKYLLEQLEKNDLVKTINLGSGTMATDLNTLTDMDIFNASAEEINDFTNWIGKNTGDYKPSKQASLYQKEINKAQDKQRIKINKDIKTRINDVQSRVKKSDKLLKQYNNFNDRLLEEQDYIVSQFKDTGETVKRIDKENIEIKNKLDNEYSKDVIEKKVAEFEERIKQNPSQAKAINKEYKQWRKGFVNEQEDLIDQYNNNLADRKFQVEAYEEFYESEQRQLDKIKGEIFERETTLNELGTTITNQIDDINLLGALDSSLALNSVELNKKLQKIQKESKGQGDYLTFIANEFTNMFASVQVGKLHPLMMLSKGFNELDKRFGPGSAEARQRRYDDANARFASFEKQMVYNKEAIANQLKLSGIDDNRARAYSEELIGGTVKAFSQMAAAAFGAPVTGLFGGFFYSSLEKTNAKLQDMEKSFVKDYMKKNNVSKSEATKAFDESFSDTKKTLYAYTQATVEGALSYVGGKILGGKIKLTGPMVSRITNGILSKVSGNVTARDIQVAVYKFVGDRASKIMVGAGKVTGSGFDEMLEELTQEFAAIGIDKTFQSMTDNAVDFDIPDLSSDEFKKQMKHVASVSFLSGNVGGSFQALSSKEDLLTVDEKNLSFKQRKEKDEFYQEVFDTVRSGENLTSQLSNLSSQKETTDMTDAEFDAKKQQIEKTYSIANKIPEDLNGRTQNQIFSLLETKQNLEQQKLNKSESAAKNIDNKIKKIDEKIADLSSNSNNRRQVSMKERIRDAVSESGQIVLDARIAKDQETINEALDAIEAEGGVVDRDAYKIDPKDFKVEIYSADNVQQIADKYNIDVDQLVDEDGNFKADGSYVAEEGVILLEEGVAEDIEVHEGTHVYLDLALNDPRNAGVTEEMAEVLLAEMKELDPVAARIVEDQIEKYKQDPNYTPRQAAEEVITYYAQLKQKGRFKKDKTRFDKLADYSRRLMQGLGMTIDVNENNVSQFIDDYVASLGKGKLTRAQKRAARGDIRFDIKTDKRKAREDKKAKLIDIRQKQDAPTKMVAAKPIKVDTRSMSEAFDRNITEDLATNEDFKNSEAAIDAFENIENNSQFNNYINQLINRDSNLQGLDSEVKQEINRKIKENLQLRALNNFKPIVDGNRRSLFSYLYGKAEQRGLGGIAQKALLDVKKEYATRVDSDARSIDKPTSEGQAFDIADTSTDIIEEVDRGVAKQPRSTFRRNIVRGKEKGLTDQEVKSFKEITQPIVDKLPPVDDKKYRTKVDQISGKELKSWVKSNILKGQDYKTFIKENYNNIRDLDLKYLIELDKGLMKQGKERMFTKPNRRLTTQADIRKYRDSGRAFVENEAQGVMLYDILDPGADATVEFYTKQTPQNVSNRKGKLAEAFGKKMFKDVLPETRAKRGDTDQQRATSARKTQVRPNLLFAKKGVNEALESLGLVPLKPRNSKGDVVSQEDIKEFEDFLINTFVKYLPVSLLTKTTLANGGRGKFPSQYFTSEQVDEIVAKARGNQDFDLTKEEREALNSVKTSVSTWWDKFKSTGDSVFKNEKWKETEGQKQKGLEILWKQFEKMYKDDPKNAKYIAAFIETSSANSSHIMRMAGYPIGYEVNWKDTLSYRGPEREHVIPANQIGEFLFKVATGRFGNKITIDKVMPFINDNYFQILINKNNDHKLKAAGFQSAMPEGFFESIIEAIDKNDPNIAMKVWARYFNPEVNNQVGPDGQKGFNPNEIILEKGSLADAFGIGSNMLSKQEINNPNIVSIQQDLIYKMSTDSSFTIKDAQKELLTYIKKPSNTQSLADEQQQATLETEKEIKESNVMVASKKMDIDELLSKAASIDSALKNANSLDQPIKKIRVFDFDDTIATSKSIVFYTKVDGTKGQLTAEEFAVKGADLVNEGAVMDFSDFNLVREGKRGPLFNIAKKIKEARGNEDLFILTARAPESQQAIYEFLKAEGLEFKKENIVGLGNSTGEAKANWIVDKAAEGYNDFYFADDAYQNVRAVRDALSVIDVKSKVQQARIKESKKLSEEFNMLLEESTGVESFKEYSAAKAKTIGASKGKFKFFIPYSAEDFLGLVYPTLTKGSKGDAQMAWYKQNLLDPYTKAQENLSAARIQLMGDFKQLKKSLDVPKDLRKKNESGFTNEQAVRVHLFTRMGYDIPGLSKRDLKELNDIVEKNPKLSTFADQILSITKGDGYASPDQNWLAGTITTDLINLINTEKRSKYLAEWQERVDAIYSAENLNKLEAIYGTKYREALEGTLTRMRTGKNRVTSGNALENRILDYINGSIGTIMFFNTRSAVLQTISSINFINWSFNNPLKAGQAFANQKQYWSDFIELINSEYLVDRRNGLKLNISESEIADAAATSKNKAKAAINYILQKGFLPTQYADSFAIASGGATFYRNRIKDLVKNQGMTESEAKAQALIEFRQVAEESQQSSDPSRISQQQASSAGRLILAFANTPMQYARLQKRAIQDLINGRGDAKSHVSRIIYYGFVQNIIFNALQQAVNVFGFGDDDDDDPKKEKKYLNVANGMLDSLLRGIGIGGAAISVGKNFLLDIYERSKRDRPEYVDSVWKFTQFSPPINSKISRLKQAAWHFDSKKRRQKILDEGFSLNSPAFEALAKVISATTNLPLDRVLYKIKNIEGALAEDTELWMRVAQLAGWPKWQLEDKKTAPVLTDEQKAKAKEDKKKTLYKEAKGSTDYDTLKKLNSAQQIKMLKSLGFGEYTIKKAKSEEDKINLIIAKNSGKKNIVNKKEADQYKYKKLSKAEQVRKLDSLGLSKDEIKALKYENDRVEKLLELMK